MLPPYNLHSNLTAGQKAYSNVSSLRTSVRRLTRSLLPLHISNPNGSQRKVSVHTKPTDSQRDPGAQSMHCSQRRAVSRSCILTLSRLIFFRNWPFCPAVGSKRSRNDDEDPPFLVSRDMMIVLQPSQSSIFREFVLLIVMRISNQVIRASVNHTFTSFARPDLWLLYKHHPVLQLINRFLLLSLGAKHICRCFLWATFYHIQTGSDRYSQTDHSITLLDASSWSKTYYRCFLWATFHPRQTESGRYSQPGHSITPSLLYSCNIPRWSSQRWRSLRVWIVFIISIEQVRELEMKDFWVCQSTESVRFRHRRFWLLNLSRQLFSSVSIPLFNFVPLTQCEAARLLKISGSVPGWSLRDPAPQLEIQCQPGTHFLHTDPNSATQDFLFLPTSHSSDPEAFGTHHCSNCQSRDVANLKVTHDYPSEISSCAYSPLIRRAVLPDAKSQT